MTIAIPLNIFAEEGPYLGVHTYGHIKVTSSVSCLFSFLRKLEKENFPATRTPAVNLTPWRCHFDFISIERG